MSEVERRKSIRRCQGLSASHKNASSSSFRLADRPSSIGAQPSVLQPTTLKSSVVREAATRNGFEF